MRIEPKETRFLLLSEVHEIAFSTQPEHEYFTAWCHSSGLGANLFPSTRLITSIIQLGYQEPPVRHAIIALGSMKLALAGDLSSTTLLKVKRESFHYKNALVNYGKSLRMLQQSTPGERCWRNVLVCCILFVAFEAICNNKATVFKHIKHGLAVARQCVIMTEKHWLRVGTSSFAASNVDDEIVHMFYRLDYQARTMNIFQSADKRPAPFSCRFSVQAISQEMPKSFETPDEAHHWLGVTRFLITNIGIHLVKLSASIKHTEASEDDAVILRNSNARALSALCLRLLTGWLQSFQPLLDETRKLGEINMKEHLQTLYLHIEYLWTYCFVFTTSFQDQDAVYRCTRHFQEIVRLADKLLSRTNIITVPGNDAQASEEPFAIEEGPVLALFIAAVKCRDRKTREQAVHLLSRHRMRNGLYDSRECHALAEWSFALEDECVRAGLSKDEYWSVLLSREASFDETKSKVYARALHRDPRTGRLVYRKDEVTW